MTRETLHQCPVVHICKHPQPLRIRHPGPCQNLRRPILGLYTQLGCLGTWQVHDQTPLLGWNPMSTGNRSPCPLCSCPRTVFHSL